MYRFKNQGDGIVRPAPVFILSNRETFPDSPEFNCRIHKYEWKTCPLLAMYSKKPDPRILNTFIMCCNDEESVNIIMISYYLIIVLVMC